MTSLFKNNQDLINNEIELNLEETYQKNFPKIARDFSTREEMQNVIMNLIQLLSEYDSELASRFSSMDLFSSGLEITKNKSLEYSENIKKPNAKKNNYKDLK